MLPIRVAQKLREKNCKKNRNNYAIFLTSWLTIELRHYKLITIKNYEKSCKNSSRKYVRSL